MRRYTRLLLFLFIPLNLFAQGLRYIPNQPLVEKSVERGLFLSRQSFQIYDRESGDIFGLNGKNEFGIQYSIGIKTLGGFFLTDRAVRPWAYDTNFEKYKKKYDPIFYQAMYAELEGKAVYDTLEYNLTQQEVIIDTTLYRFPSRTFGGDGFILDHTVGEKEGWVVWITVNQDVDLEKMDDFNYTIYKKTLTIKDREGKFQIDQPNTEQKVLGGIYVVPFNTKIGILEFRLCGILVPSDKGWEIYCPFVGSKNEVEVPDKAFEEKREKPVELTPIGKTDKEQIKDTKKKK